VDVLRNLAAALLVAALGCGSSASNGGLDSGADAVVREGVPSYCVDASPSQSCVAADIHASSYDQACHADSDCLLVVEGYACAGCSVCAPLSAINSSAFSQYEADVGKVVGPTTGGGGCAPCCGPVLLACCQGGQCQARTSCSTDGGAE
jgi:hypothetical protein